MDQPALVPALCSLPTTLIFAGPLAQVDNTGLVKLADFGASKRIEDMLTMGAWCGVGLWGSWVPWSLSGSRMPGRRSRHSVPAGHGGGTQKCFKRPQRRCIMLLFALRNCRLWVQVGEGHALLDGARGDHPVGPWTAGRHLVGGLHCDRDGHRQAALEPVWVAGARVGWGVGGQRWQQNNTMGCLVDVPSAQWQVLHSRGAERLHTPSGAWRATVAHST